MQVIAVKLELSQFAFQAASIDTQVEQSAEEHVAAYATEDVEIEGLHQLSPASALI